MIELDRGGWMTLDPSFLGPEEASTLLSTLRTELTWQQEHIRIAGKSIAQPRLTAWYGDAGAAYTYSGLSLDPRPWHPSLDTTRRLIEAQVGVPLNSVLCNLYRDGRDSMGWHADAEGELGRDPLIASLSLGGARRFLIRLRGKPAKKPVELSLGHGSLLVMGGSTQHHHQHSVPKQRAAVAPRINLTFRQIVGPGAPAD